MGQLLITFGLFTYLFAIGLREGYTWASHQRRLTNGIISGGSKIDYHAWRHIESIGVWIAAGGVLFSELPLGWLALYFWSSWQMGHFFYRIALKKVTTNEWFAPVEDDYHLLGFVLPARASQVMGYAFQLVGLLAMLFVLIAN